MWHPAIHSLGYEIPRQCYRAKLLPNRLSGFESVGGISQKDYRLKVDAYTMALQTETIGPQISSIVESHYF